MGADGIDFANRAAVESRVSDDGAATLSWGEVTGAGVELQQAADADFTAPVTRYRGTDPGTVLTGLAEGTHYFRLREAGSPEWSPPLAVRVAFVPRRRLFAMLAIGFVVAAATVGAIVAGHLRTRNRTGEEDALA
ncbi:MAG: hypothetical protein KDM91_01430 [Verrucomicrobiae bacterium]|nr:hypothetical protein [Verrucomicrobiae bacterium]MCP5539973.1 hypothetical protein [Akkermansiaceae bacterium]MCP5549906.1 hypothetical protein [Akkermansiaceae bacterium]